MNGDKIKTLLEERGELYGDAVVMFSRVAEVWSGILGKPVTPIQVLLMMTGLKLVRAEVTPQHVDNIDDGQGYLELVRRFIGDVE